MSAGLVVRFGGKTNEKLSGDAQTLGEKGLRSIEMSNLGLPVPVGFVLKAEACRAFLADPTQISDEVKTEVLEAIAWARANAAKFGGDGTRVTLVGHSAGAHLALYATARALTSPSTPPSTPRAPRAAESCRPTALCRTSSIMLDQQHYVGPTAWRSDRVGTAAPPPRQRSPGGRVGIVRAPESTLAPT